jgi:uncharacterized tellurite resistance protein B-like protein
MILAALGFIVTILILFNRLADSGIDIGWLNPFTWFRRKSWRDRSTGNPIFTMTKPIDVAVVLAVTVAKIDGDISQQEKEALVSLFQDEFEKSEKEASDMMIFGTHLFADGHDAISKPEKIIKFSLEQFTEEQAQSLMNLLNNVLKIGNLNINDKEKYIQRINTVFASHFKTNEKW